ncbi:MAG: ABC transporter permease, partial [Gemmatimonadaceae bacterium]
MKSFLTRLVALFPAGFRDRFQEDMIEQIERDYDRARDQGRWSALSFIVCTSGDLLGSALAERVRPAWVSAQLSRSEVGGMPLMRHEWTRDLRYATRALLRSSGFTAVAVGTLGLAIGVNAAMFSVVNRVLLHPLPYPHADRIVHIAGTAPGSGFPDEFGLSSEFYLAYKESKLIEDISTYNSFTSTMRAGDRVERIRMSWPTYTLFSTLGAKPILGRLPAAEDEERVAVISYELWTSWFGRDSSVIGRSYVISGGSRTVVGVMAPDFKFPNASTMLWLSGTVRAAGLVPGRFGDAMVARMAPGVTPEALARELTAISKRLPERFGGSANYRRVIALHRAVVRPIRDQLLGGVSGPLWVLLAAVAIALVIACANVANLFM